ncbi:unnamed protein product [Wuchereria bancrofti]|uniref:Uncharacterized protein n=1 Tax=Wuchereria bancrofti TaxID=6293 RepID=A0A3P7FWW7_WUCBA|nr:unnamed protein product [Wuchereria bancrofti]
MAFDNFSSSLRLLFYRLMDMPEKEAINSGWP